MLYVLIVYCLLLFRNKDLIVRSLIINKLFISEGVILVAFLVNRLLAPSRYVLGVVEGQSLELLSFSNPIRHSGKWHVY